MKLTETDWIHFEVTNPNAPVLVIIGPRGQRIELRQGEKAIADNAPEKSNASPPSR